MATGEPKNGREFQIKLTPVSPNTGSAITLNCTGDIPTAPAMNAPEITKTTFQEGDVMTAKTDGGYQSSQWTCEKRNEDYETIDQARANGYKWNVTLGADGFTGEAIITVSTGPLLPADGEAVETMTIQADWTSTKKPNKTA